MITWLKQNDADAAYGGMCLARDRGQHDAARELAGLLRTSIANGGPLPHGPMGIVGSDIIAALATTCAQCGELMVMAGGLWLCPARTEIVHDVAVPC